LEHSLKAITAVLFGLVAFTSISSNAQTASLTPTQAVQVTAIEGSKSATNGYFVMTTANPVAGCESGFWLPVSDAKYAAYFARVNDVLASKAPLVVAGDKAQMWPGSTDKVCRIAQMQ
jgi:hypothetical protein